MKVRVCTAILLLLSIVGYVRAQDDRRAQVAAATDNAIESLRIQIGQAQLDRDLTVDEFLSRTQGHEQFGQTLLQARQIGGPRWLEAHTCQVRLEIAGQRVAETLKQIATENPERSPIAPAQLAGQLKDWDQRTFTATGTSAGALAVAQALPPREHDAWVVVSDEARRRAVIAAREDAVNRAIESIASIRLDGETIGEALRTSAVRGAVEQWLAARPVTRVEFRDDLRVRLTLAAPASELYETFRVSAIEHKAVALAPDDAKWNDVRQAFVQRVVSVTGQAAATPDAEIKVAIALPEVEPDWVDRQLDAEGWSSRQRDPLLTARAAEADAAARLRAQIEALHLSDQVTVGDAVRQSPRLNEALDRALMQLRTQKVDYQPDGSARVRVFLSLRTVWEELKVSN